MIESKLMAVDTEPVLQYTCHSVLTINKVQMSEKYELSTEKTILRMFFFKSIFLV